jgi:Leucine-rich repeat (LRR) protein
VEVLYLVLYKNQIGDVKPLAKLTNLTDLEIGWNQIGDVKPLAGLTNRYRQRISYVSKALTLIDMGVKAA